MAGAWGSQVGHEGTVAPRGRCLSVLAQRRRGRSQGLVLAPRRRSSNVSPRRRHQCARCARSTSTPRHRWHRQSLRDHSIAGWRAVVERRGTQLLSLPWGQSSHRLKVKGELYWNVSLPATQPGFAQPSTSLRHTVDRAPSTDSARLFSPAVRARRWSPGLGPPVNVAPLGHRPRGVVVHRELGFAHRVHPLVEVQRHGLRPATAVAPSDQCVDTATAVAR